MRPNMKPPCRNEIILSKIFDWRYRRKLCSVDESEDRPVCSMPRRNTMPNPKLPNGRSASAASKRPKRKKAKKKSPILPPTGRV